MSLYRTLFSVFLLTSIGIGIISCKNEHKTLSEEIDSDQSDQNADQLLLIEDLEGNEMDLDDFKGKVVILNFWATWCKPCISEMPSFDRLIEQLGKDEFVFLAASDENVDKIKRFVESNPHDFKYVHLKSNVYSLGLSVLPTTFIINKEGEIIDKIVGAREWDSSESYEMLKNI